MARLQSAVKLGFYETPVKTTAEILRFLKVQNNESKYHVLDPCAGEGIALQSVGSISSNIVTYGVELEGNRAAESKKVIDKVATCSAFDSDIPKNSFGLLWLNPPYGNDRDKNGKRIRTELIFFLKAIDWLAPSGVLVFIIPDYIVKDRLAKAVASHVENISAYKIAESEYDKFRQVVVFGTKRNVPKINPASAQKLINTVYQADFITNINSVTPYSIVSTKAPLRFRSKIPTLEEMTHEIRHSQINKDFDSMLYIEDDVLNIRTVTPLKRGHLATLLASGYLDGVVDNGKQKILVKGFSQKIKVSRTENVGDFDNPKTKYIETDKIQIAVRYMTQNGKITEVK